MFQCDLFVKKIVIFLSYCKLIICKKYKYKPIDAVD